ncbi:hypothetical protein GCM10027601_34370 [Nocardioides ungokensis]
MGIAFSSTPPAPSPASSRGGAWRSTRPAGTSGASGRVPRNLVPTTPLSSVRGPMLGTLAGSRRPSTAAPVENPALLSPLWKPINPDAPEVLQ